VETTDDFIFGGFTTAEWESADKYFSKPDHHSFLFSVNEGSKYPIASGDARTTIFAIQCRSGWCARFGYGELAISTDSNDNTGSLCNANYEGFKLPAAEGSEFPSLNGGQ
jgi:hypothetical protein